MCIRDRHSKGARQGGNGVGGAEGEHPCGTPTGVGACPPAAHREPNVTSSGYGCPEDDEDDADDDRDPGDGTDDAAVSYTHLDVYKRQASN